MIVMARVVRVLNRDMVGGAILRAKHMRHDIDRKVSVFPNAQLQLRLRGHIRAQQDQKGHDKGSHAVGLRMWHDQSVLK